MSTGRPLLGHSITQRILRKVQNMCFSFDLPGRGVNVPLPGRHIVKVPKLLEKVTKVRKTKKEGRKKTANKQTKKKVVEHF